MDDVRIRVIKGSLMTLNQFNKDYDPAVHGAVGISEPEWRALTSAKPWTVRDKGFAAKGLDAVISGSLELAGLAPSFTSVEFVAAAITCIVNPVNWMVAASFGRTIYKADELLATEASAEQNLIYQSPERLYALVCYVAAERDGEVPFTPRWDQPDE